MSNRRDFLKQTTLGGAGFWLGGWRSQAQADLVIPPSFQLRHFASKWGFQGDIDAFCQVAKAAGYQGIEIWLPQPDAVAPLQRALDKHELSLGLLVRGETADAKEHLAQFVANAKRAAALKPAFMNGHTGKEYFTFEQGKPFFTEAAAISAQTGIPFYHETHRARLLFAAHITQAYLEAVPEMRLTLDISHWVVVHNHYLDELAEALQLAFQRTAHIHSRVGYSNGPQVADPRAPNESQALDEHLAWWDAVVKARLAAGENLTITPEFGPPSYMPTVPFTGQPLGNQWEINLYMKALLTERYGA
jgi:sugar phosphate isomerase/epimerase